MQAPDHRASCPWASPVTPKYRRRFPNSRKSFHQDHPRQPSSVGERLPYRTAAGSDEYRPVQTRPQSRRPLHVTAEEPHDAPLCTTRVQQFKEAHDLPARRAVPVHHVLFRHVLFAAQTQRLTRPQTVRVGANHRSRSSSEISPFRQSACSGK